MNDSFRILLEEKILSDGIEHSVVLLEGPIKQTERAVQVHVSMQPVIRVSPCTLHILMTALLFVLSVCLISMRRRWSENIIGTIGVSPIWFAVSSSTARYSSVMMCVYVYVYVNVYTHTHTYTHTL